MSTIYSLKSINSSLSRTDAPVFEDRKHSSIEHDTKQKTSLLGLTLHSLAEAVVRAVAGCIALIGYVMTLFCWEQAKDFGLKQIEQAVQAKDYACQCFHQIFPQKTLTKEKITDKIQPKIEKSSSIPNPSQTDEKPDDKTIKTLDSKVKLDFVHLKGCS